VEVIINKKTYNFTKDAIKKEETRESYFSLLNSVFRINFNAWYESGFCGNSFTPYTLFDDDIAVAAVGAVVSDFKWNGVLKRYVQITSVLTHLAYREQGLSKWLMELVLKEWKDNCDAIYLYANDKVTSFYPKFGFVLADEYTYSMPLLKTDGLFRKLDLNVKDDVDLLVKKHNESNPFSSLAMNKGSEVMMFHCITFLYNDIYYIEKYDAVVIATQYEHKMFCYDIYTNKHCDIKDLLGIISSDAIRIVTLGFTPSDATGYTAKKANEKGTNFFVLSGKENILVDNKVTFPFLSRA